MAAYLLSYFRNAPLSCKLSFFCMFRPHASNGSSNMFASLLLRLKPIRSAPTCGTKKVNIHLFLDSLRSHIRENDNHIGL